MVVAAFVFVVPVFVVSSSCTTGVNVALALAPDDICDDGDDDDGNEEYKDNMTGASEMIDCDLSFSLALWETCGRGRVHEKKSHTSMMTALAAAVA